MADKKQIDIRKDVVQLFEGYGANLIQMALFYKNLEEPEKDEPEVLALTDLEGLEPKFQG